MTTDAKTKPLNPRQTRYAQLLAEGKHQNEAFREAFPFAAAWKETSVKPKASTLAKDPRVQALIRELQAEGAQAAVYTLADHLQRLHDLSTRAEKSKDWTAAIRAEEARGKAAGFYVQKAEISGPNGGPIESKQTRDLTDEELAAELAKHGIQP